MQSETPTRAPKPFRILIEQIELALKFGSSEELESACNELLSSVKIDQYELQVKSTFSHPGARQIGSAPFIHSKIQQYVNMKENLPTVHGVFLRRHCGHCEAQKQIASSYGEISDSHLQHLVDNFPQEL